MINFLNRFLKVKTFEELRIPLAITATDFASGEGVVFRTGPLADPVRASCAYPGVFLPVSINGRLLVDGMLAHSLPTKPLRDMGADRVIAVSLKSNWAAGGEGSEAHLRRDRTMFRDRAKHELRTGPAKRRLDHRTGRHRLPLRRFRAQRRPGLARRALHPRCASRNPQMDRTRWSKPNPFSPRLHWWAAPSTPSPRNKLVTKVISSGRQTPPPERVLTRRSIV